MKIIFKQVFYKKFFVDVITLNFCENKFILSLSKDHNLKSELQDFSILMKKMSITF